MCGLVYMSSIAVFKQHLNQEWVNKVFGFFWKNSKCTDFVSSQVSAIVVLSALVNLLMKHTFFENFSLENFFRWDKLIATVPHNNCGTYQINTVNIERDISI